MKYYLLKIGKVTRKLPIVSLGPKIKVASFNLLGDTEMVNEIAKKLTVKIKNIDFDYLVGPEVKVVPLLHKMSELLGPKRYIVCRKEIHGYMVSPIKSGQKGLVLNGTDKDLIKGKKIVIVDDVVSTGSTVYSVEKLMNLADAKVTAKIAIFQQGTRLHNKQNDIIFLGKLPVFTP